MSTGGVRQRRAGQTAGDTVILTSGSQDGRDRGEASRILSMFIKGIVSGLLICLVTLLAIELFISSPIEPESFTILPPPEFKGALTPNDILSKAERLYEDRLLGPESVIFHEGHLYTGTADGKILHIEGNNIETVANLGQPPCGKFEDEPTCGRPLGMRFDKDGYLVVADAYLGLYKVNVATGDVHQYFPSTMKVDGKESKFLNGLDIGSDGTIYLTDSSTKWDRRNYRYEIAENGAHGRLMKYDPETNTTTLIDDELHFPNGVQLSKDGEYLLVPETSRCRILRYYLEGPRTGELDVFADNLPILPDNIKRSGRGGFWVGGAIVRNPNKFQMFDFTANKPWLRKYLTKILSQDMMLKLAGQKYGLVLELDKDGNVVRSFHDPTGKVVPAVSEVEEHMGVLYMGSYFSPFIAKLDLKKAGAYDPTPLN